MSHGNLKQKNAACSFMYCNTWYHDLFVDAVRRIGGMTPNDSRIAYNEM